MWKKLWEIGVILLLNLALLCAAGDSAAIRLFRPSQEAYSSFGDKSGEVEQVQQQLKNLNYYSGEVNGFFGLTTRAAIKKFQRENGLEVSGEGDEQTLEALKIKTENNSALGDTDFELLARFAAAQCGGEDTYGKMAEIYQLLELTKGRTAPESVAAVLFQRGRFGCVEDTMLKTPATEDCRAAIYLLCG